MMRALLILLAGWCAALSVGAAESETLPSTVQQALKQAGVPAELHVFPSGGHGYGLRPTEHAVTGWPNLCNTWLEGILEK